MDKNRLFTAVINGIPIKRNKQTTPREAKHLLTLLNKLDTSQFTDKSISTVITVLVNTLSDKLNKLPPEFTESTIDIHEMQVAAIGNNSDSNVYDKKIPANATLDSLLHSPSILRGIINPDAQHKKAYVYLDRKFQSKDSDNIQEFKWSLATHNDPYDPLTTVLTTAPLRDIIAVKAHPFLFPFTPNTITDRHRFTIEIMELNTQGYFIPAYRKKFHLSFDIEKSTVTGGPYRMIDIGQSVSDFHFHEAIMEMKTITLRFANPERNISLDPDSLYGTISAVGAQTRIDFSTTPHWCAVSDTVIITGFNTSLPVADSVQIDLINSIDGWPITALTATTITIDVDLSGISGAIVGNPFYIYLDSKRFCIRLEFTYISD